MPNSRSRAICSATAIIHGSPREEHEAARRREHREHVRELARASQKARLADPERHAQYAAYQRAYYHSMTDEQREARTVSRRRFGRKRLAAILADPERHEKYLEEARDGRRRRRLAALLGDVASAERQQGATFPWTLKYLI